MTAEQSVKPEDTKRARELDMTAEDFGNDESLPMLTRDAILAAEDNTLVKVPCPEWGGYVYARNPTGEERNRFEQASMVVRGRNTREMAMKDLKERLVVQFACDDKRQPIFKHEDVATLAAKNAAPINRIGDMILKLGGWTDQDVEDLVGNSDGAQS